MEDSIIATIAEKGMSVLTWEPDESRKDSLDYIDSTGFQTYIRQVLKLSATPYNVSVFADDMIDVNIMTEATIRVNDEDEGEGE